MLPYSRVCTLILFQLGWIYWNASYYANRIRSPSDLHGRSIRIRTCRMVLFFFADRKEPLSFGDRIVKTRVISTRLGSIVRSTAVETPNSQTTPTMPINDIFGWIILLFLPTYLVWIGFVQIRHKQEWVLVMWSIRHIKKESNPLSPKELGIDSKLFSAKLFFYWSLARASWPGNGI